MKGPTDDHTQAGALPTLSIARADDARVSDSIRVCGGRTRLGRLPMHRVLSLREQMGRDSFLAAGICEKGRGTVTARRRYFQSLPTFRSDRSRPARSKKHRELSYRV